MKTVEREMKPEKYEAITYALSHIPNNTVSRLKSHMAYPPYSDYENRFEWEDVSFFLYYEFGMTKTAIYDHLFLQVPFKVFQAAFNRFDEHCSKHGYALKRYERPSKYSEIVGELVKKFVSFLKKREVYTSFHSFKEAA